MHDFISEMHLLCPDWLERVDSLDDVAALAVRLGIEELHDEWVADDAAVKKFVNARAAAKAAAYVADEIAAIKAERRLLGDD
jgi:hypothetical protein